VVAGCITGLKPWASRTLRGAVLSQAANDRGLSMKNKTGKKISDAQIEDILGVAIDHYFENPEAVRYWIGIRIAFYDEAMKQLRKSERGLKIMKELRKSERGLKIRTPKRKWIGVPIAQYDELVKQIRKLGRGSKIRTPKRTAKL
jgi:hypothetical protein